MLGGGATVPALAACAAFAASTALVTGRFEEMRGSAGLISTVPLRMAGIFATMG